jgi:hypothetical protein
MQCTGLVLPRNDRPYANMTGGWKKVIGRMGSLSSGMPS